MCFHVESFSECYFTCTIILDCDNITVEKNEVYQSREETITQLIEAYRMCTWFVMTSPNDAYS